MDQESIARSSRDDALHIDANKPSGIPADHDQAMTR